MSATIYLLLDFLVYVFFCVSRYGWGWNNFIQEANAGMGMKVEQKTRFYLSYILPVIILIVFVFGYIQKFNLL